MTAEELAAARQNAFNTLTDWFKKYGGNAEVEIEVHFGHWTTPGETGPEEDIAAGTSAVRAATAVVASNGAYHESAFVATVAQRLYYVLSKKFSHGDSWVGGRPTKSETLDTFHRSGIRGQQTRNLKTGEFGAPLYVQKDKTLEPFVHCGPYRLCVAKECELPPVDSEMDPPTLVRFKRRTSFNYKNLFLYELTEVGTGETAAAAMGAAPSFEVEIEWIGQKQKHGRAPDALANSLVCKINDVLKIFDEADSGRAGGILYTAEKSVRVANGSVTLYRKHAVFGTEIPHDVAVQLHWLPGRVVEDGQRVEILALPGVVHAGDGRNHHVGIGDLSGHVSRKQLQSITH